MNQFRLALTMSVGLIASAALAASAPHAVVQVKHGLWNFTDSTKIVGDTVFPDTIKTAPGDRSKQLADIRRMLSEPSGERECLTQASLEQRVFTVGKSCKQTIVSNSPRQLDVLTECQAKLGSFTQDTNERLVISGPTSVVTTIHSVSTQGGKTMTMDSVMRGHLVSADCGKVHTIEQLR